MLSIFESDFGTVYLRIVKGHKISLFLCISNAKHKIKIKHLQKGLMVLFLKWLFFKWNKLTSNNFFYKFVQNTYFNKRESVN